MKNKTNKHRLFSKALFKQSCKANGIMWGIITLAVCFTLACVMLISGTSNISSVKTGVQDTIIEELIQSEIKKTAVNLYVTTEDSEVVFDNAFADKFNELNTKENAIIVGTIKAKAEEDGKALITARVTEKVTAEVTERIKAEIEARVASESDEIKAEVTAAVASDMASEEAATKVGAKMAEGKSLTEAQQEVIAEYSAIEKERILNEHIAKATADIATDAHKAEVAQAVLTEKQEEYKTEALDELDDELSAIEAKATEDTTAKIKEVYITPSYLAAVDAVTKKYPNDGDTKSNYGAAMVTINPNNQAKDQYENNKESVPDEYINELVPYITVDILAWSYQDTQSTELSNYIKTEERCNFRYDRAYKGCSMLIASKMTSPEYKEEILNILKDYKVNEAKYDSMGFDYKNVFNISFEGMLEYQDKYNYEVSLISNDIKNNKEAYDNALKEIHDKLYTSVAGSLLDKLPENVSEGIEELGTMDLYGLIVGSIFFKMAGLLLPIIYVIMVSNNLVAGQVDNGSMAYVLSTSTRREEVTFTQAIYLVGSLFLMFVCTTITSLVCFAIADVNTDLTYTKLILINVGAFCVLFAISGINYLTSCYFDRSKRAMALGGGISIFFLVATMLGLFGSSVIPSVVRISALNNFNYASLISLFDVVSILRGEYTWIWKIVILVAVGLVGYISGSIKFKKKDLPL